MSPIFLTALWVIAIPVIEDTPASSALSVQIVQIHEVRHKDFRKSPPKPQIGSVNPDAQEILAVTIELAGAASARAEKYGFVQITKVEDDQGKALKPREGFGMNTNPHDRLVDVDRESMFFWEKTKPNDKLRVTLYFDVPARSSKALKTLTGKLKLFVIKERKEVIVADILSMQGKTIENDLLKSAGLIIKVTKVEDKSKAVTFETSGNQDSLLELALVDAAGKGINVATMTMTLGGKTSRTLQPVETVPVDARLKLTIGLGQETVEVPFSFTDIPLP
ncbi:MAG: hypothetical protein IH895_00315 [Planctomycetes bacterium]|nr:hypothetical protein [Planctomycetota bacterium]